MELREQIQEAFTARFGASEERTEIALNALRLLRDAALLYNHQRYASSFALGVLAWEEVGKLIINVWQSQCPIEFPNGHRLTHRRKQAATNSLLVAKQAQEIAKENYSGGPFDEDLIERLAEELCQTDAMHFSRLIEIGAVDKTKELALYRDEWLSALNLHVDIFERSPDKSMLQKTLAAFREVLNARCMDVGRILFESYLEREAKRPERRPYGNRPQR